MNQLIRVWSTELVRLYSTLSFSGQSLEQSMETWTPVGMKSQYPAPHPRSSWPPFSFADRSSWGRCLFISPEDKLVTDSPSHRLDLGTPECQTWKRRILGGCRRTHEGGELVGMRKRRWHARTRWRLSGAGAAGLKLLIARCAVPSSGEPTVPDSSLSGRSCGRQSLGPSAGEPLVPGRTLVQVELTFCL